MDQFTDSCWSWTHQTEIVPSLSGRFVCENCIAEESRIIKTHEQLNKIENAIQMYLQDASLQRQHPAQAQVLERIISDFFLESVPALKAGKGYRINFGAKTQSELDVILDFDSDNWLSDQRRELLANPPLAHIEVCYRKRFDPTKIENDFMKLHETVIGGAALLPPQKVWTAFVGLGPGWGGKRKLIAQAIHEHFHKIKPKRINMEDSQAFWDYPDVLMFPGVIFKKHDCSSEPGLIDHWPVYIQMPSALNDPVYDLRPLSAARGFFASFVKSTLHGKINLAPCWTDEDSSSILGPNLRLEDDEQILISLEHTPRDLFIKNVLPQGRTLFLHFKAVNISCTKNKRYLYRRDRDSKLDSKSILLIN